MVSRHRIAPMVLPFRCICICYFEAQLFDMKGPDYELLGQSLEVVAMGCTNFLRVSVGHRLP